MGRRPEGKTARTRTITFRLTEEGAEVFDRLRGSMSSSGFLRWLIAKEADRRGSNG
jgi:hypothetical protein